MRFASGILSKLGASTILHPNCQQVPDSYPTSGLQTARIFDEQRLEMSSKDELIPVTVRILERKKKNTDLRHTE